MFIGNIEIYLYFIQVQWNKNIDKTMMMMMMMRNLKTRLIFFRIITTGYKDIM